MALIDIDRHLLSEISYNIRHLQESSERMYQAFDDMAKAAAKLDVLVKENGVIAKPAFPKERRAFWRAVDKGKFEARHIQVHNAKIEALSYHLVSAIKEVDTGRGQETKEK
jgi:hypothetical protein